MGVSAAALDTPTKSTVDSWLDIPRYAKCGVLFTPSEPMWWPDRTVRWGVNWEAALQCVPLEWRCWLHVALALRMEVSAQGTVGQIVSVLARAAADGLNPLDLEHLIDLRERFRMTEFSSLLGFLEFWHKSELVEYRPSKSLIDAYQSLPKKKNSKNDPILSLDPEKGPFTKIEQNDLFFWINEQFSHGYLEAERYLYFLMAMYYGQRISQLRMLVFRDFFQTEKGCFVRIFHSKQRGVNARWRDKSKVFSLKSSLYYAVKCYQDQVLAQLKIEYPTRADWNKAIEHVPLFRRKLNGRGGDLNNLPVIVDLPDLNILEEKPDMQFHISDGSISAWLKKMEATPGFPISARTKRPLKISKTHRFRHTLGTDLSNAGMDEYTIAAALMHTSLSTVRKYRQISPELMSLVDRKMSDSLAFVVGAFTGTIIESREEAKNGDQIEQQIEDLAVCGADAVCNLDAPFTCYGCSKFQPFLDADHGAVLQRLERRRKQALEADKTTAAVWDRSILACRKVIFECEALRNKNKGVTKYE